MIFLKLDDVKVPFVTRGTPLAFYYNLYKSRTSNNQGNFRINLLETDIREFDSVDIIFDDISVNIPYTSKILIEGVDSTVTIEFLIPDIFKLYDDITNMFYQKGAEDNYLHVCTDTSMNCNLACPYCCVGSNIKKVYPRTNIILADYYMKKLYNLSKKYCINPVTDIRIIGGETFLDMNDFKRVFDYTYKLCKNEIKNLFVYSNFTVNIDKFCDYIEQKFNEYDSFGLYCFVSTDSFDYTKSLRMPKPEIIQDHKNNIKLFGDRFRNNDKVNFIFNCMFIDESSVREIAEYCKSNGVRYYQLSTDEHAVSNNDITSKQDIVQKMDDILQNEYGLIRLKPNYGQTMWCLFSISDEYNDVMKVRKNYKVDYIAQSSLNF